MGSSVISPTFDRSDWKFFGIQWWQSWERKSRLERPAFLRQLLVFLALAEFPQFGHTCRLRLKHGAVFHRILL